MAFLRCIWTKLCFKIEEYLIVNREEESGKKKKKVIVFLKFEWKIRVGDDLCTIILPIMNKRKKSFRKRKILDETLVKY